MPLSLTKSCLISIRVVASRVSARWHHTVFRFSLMSATSFSNASFSTLWFFFSSLPTSLASGACSLGWSSVPSSDFLSLRLHHCHKSCAPDWNVLWFSGVGQQLHCLLMHRSSSRQNCRERKSTRQKRIMTVNNKLVLF